MADKINTNSSSLINIAARLLSGRLQERLIENDIHISVEQWRLLYYLWEKDGISQQELATIANKEKSTITRQLKELENKGLIERLSNGNDKRNKLLFVTSTGKCIKHDALGVAAAITSQAESTIKVEELEIFKKVLREIIKNISE